MAESEFQAEPPQRRTTKPRPARLAEDDIDVRQPDAVEALIPYRNPQALIAYYLGVFSLIPCVALALGPAALVLGILGLRYHKKHPTAGGIGHAIAGIVLGGLTTLAHIVLLLVIVVGAIVADKR
jgi:hypothetical protein